MYGLAAHEEKDENSARWMEIAKGITNTCHESYDRSDTKLGPEAFRFSDAVEARSIKANERYYILRPETFESYFIMWRLTKDQKYRDWGWEAVQVRKISLKMYFFVAKYYKTEHLQFQGLFAIMFVKGLNAKTFNVKQFGLWQEIFH